MRKLPLTIRSGASAPTECANTRPELTPTIGSAMASAEREPTRAPARVESESVRDQHLGAGGRIVSLAFQRFHQGEVAQDPAGWLAGLNVGLLGGSPTGLRDCIKDAAQRADGESQEANDCLEGLRHVAPFWSHAAACPTLVGLGAMAMIARPPRRPIDLEATTKDVRLRLERVLAGISRR
jgi:hypothetical protein